MTHGLILRLNEQRPYASPAERNIIAYVQANPQAVLSLSIRELASATYTSPSTITRIIPPGIFTSCLILAMVPI